MPRLAAALVAVFAVLAALALPQSAPASASTTTTRSTPVFAGLTHKELTFRLDDGRNAVANVLEFRADDPGLQLRGVLGRDVVPGLETVPSMGRRKLGEGAVAGVNAGFWLRNPVGDPNGFFTLNGRLVSEAETQGAGPRGTLARRIDGSFLMDRIDTTVSLSVNDTTPLHVVAAVNRFHRSTPPYPDDTVGPVYLYTPEFGQSMEVKRLVVNEVALPMRVLTVEGLRPAAEGRTSGTVLQVRSSEGPVPIPAGGSLVVAHGQAATRMTEVTAGDRISVNVQIKPMTTPAEAWKDLADGVAAGPLVVRNGQRVDPSGWEHEGFAPASHSNVRHPRSAVGLTDDGRVLLITVDGRQSGYSAGMTMHELSHFLRTLGVRDGLSLDGGASTQFVVDGMLRNRPCCDKSLRPVATGLFVFHDYPFAHSRRIAGAGREATAAAIATAAYPDGAREVVLAAAANFPDALAGGPLAALRNAPLLLTGRDELPTATRQALDRLKPSKVTLLGGTGVISEKVEVALRAAHTVERIAGRDRTETAAQVAAAMGARHERVFLAVADRFPDALSAAGPAGMLGAPILLTRTGQMPPATLTAIEASGASEVIVVGGRGAVADDVVDELRVREFAVRRLAGHSRYGTARAVNEWAAQEIPGMSAAEIVIAYGGSFPDALAGGPLAALRRQALMIVPPVDALGDPDARGYLEARAAAGLQRVTLVGGHAALSSYQHWQLDALAAR